MRAVIEEIVKKEEKVLVYIHSVGGNEALDYFLT
jgi:hypothetical protein